MKLARTLLLLLMCCSVVGFASCGQPTDVFDPVVSVDESNEEWNQAVAKARATFGQFLENREKFEKANVKFGVPASDGSREYIWFSPTEITDSEITGVCANAPAKVPGLKLGDTRKFKRSELTDWMIMDGSNCYGGYTIRVLVKMDPKNAPPMNFVDF